METKTVYVVYGTSAELYRLVSYLVATGQPFHFNPEYCYFNSDPAFYLKDSGLTELTVSEERWSLNCLNFKDAPKLD